MEGRFGEKHAAAVMVLLFVLFRNAAQEDIEDAAECLTGGIPYAGFGAAP